MSTSRAKRKRRQRARAVGDAPSVGAKGGASAGAKAGGGAQAAARGKASAGAKGGGGAGSAKAGGAESRRGAEAAGAQAGVGARMGAKVAAAVTARAGAGRAGGGGIPRPDPIWAPFPLTEIGMAVGLFIFALGVEASNASMLSIGALMLGVVVGELCLREHFAGFRSHAILLAALAVVAAHTVVVLALTDAYTGPLSLAVDLAIGGALAWWLRERFASARNRRLTA